MSALTPLGLNLSGLITQVISFIILFAILYKLLYQPVINMLDQRSAKIKNNLDAADKAKQDIAKSEQSIQDSLNAAKDERRQMIIDAKDAASKFREEEIQKSKADIEAEWIKARAEIQREKDSAIDEVRRNFAGLVIAAAEQVIDTSLDDKAHDEVIQKVLKKSL